MNEKNKNYDINDNMNRLIFLAESYDLVVGDEFQLFYRGVIRSMNPYKYYIYVNCEKGKPYPRYYTFTPKDSDVGSYKLSITLYDDYMNEIERGETTLIVHKIEPCKDKLNILCVGDSLTFNGVWPSVGATRFEDSKINEGEPISYGMGDNFNFIGTCKKEVEYENGVKSFGYEGYGGWQWRHFVLNEAVDASSGVWVEYKNNPFDENDQHSIWLNGNLKWVMESIEKDRIKFKRGPQNWSCSNKIDLEFTHFEGGTHKDSFKIEGFEYEKGNPFYIKEKGLIDFKEYCNKHNFDGIDYCYILLSWNGQYKPFNQDQSHHEEFMNKLIDQLHRDYPNCKVRLIGIQSCSIDGGIASNYGAHGYYHDTFGEVSTCFFYDKFLEEYCARSNHKDFMRYIDLKAQFDVENNMPHFELPVNCRCKKTELIGSNGVHPTLDGYKQMGDVFFRALVRDVIDYNKNK